ncbi:hypothetical protein KKF25_01690, partial [Patescibacteria group bacterium]|nr:hypothetical protein [Patescibacteria group bacterium]
MKILSYKKNNLACLLLFVLAANLIIGGVLLPTKMAKAQYPVTDATQIGQNTEKSIWDKIKDAWTKVQSTLQTGYQGTLSALGISKKVQDKIEKALTWAFRAFKKRLLGMMTDDIVKWIGGGGKPRFVTDWQGFLKTAADRTAGQFIMKLGGGFLCGPFAIKLQIALAKPQTFEESVTCTLSTITANIENFFNDFSQGGWKGWLTVSEPQNNIFGANLMAIDQKYDLITKAQEAAKNEAAAGSGYLDSKVCTKRQCPNRVSNQPGPIENFSGGAAAGGWKQDELDQGDGYFCECLNWATRSPGKIAADLLSKVAGQDWDWLLQSKEYSEYIFAIADAVINRIIKEGVLAIKSAGSSSGYAGISMSASAASVDLSVYADAAKNNVATATLIPQEKLLKENLNKNLSEYQKNLDVLNQ